MRNCRGWIFAACLGLVSAEARSATAELPVWTEEDRAALREGAPLSGIVLFRPLEEDGAPEEEVAAIEVEQPVEVSEPETPPSMIPEEYLADYFEKKPEQFLVDPQVLLTRQEYRDRLTFLEYHAGDSEIDLYVYLFDNEQEIPGEARAEEVIERLFSDGRPAVVIYYHLGAPQRAKLFLSPQLAQVVSAAEQQRSVQSSINAAMEKSDPVDQLAGFSVQMSIRLYWMEKILMPDAVVTEPVVMPVTAPAVLELPRESRSSAFFRTARAWLLPVALLGGAVAAGSGWRWWLVRNRVCRFPEYEQPRRLGGVHAAGIGAVISFRSSAVPPAVQREQVPDYLRRL